MKENQQIINGYRLGSICRLEEELKGGFDLFSEIGGTYNYREQRTDCLFLLGLLETISFVETLDKNLQEILDQ